MTISSARHMQPTVPTATSALATLLNEYSNGSLQNSHPMTEPAESGNHTSPLPASVDPRYFDRRMLGDDFYMVTAAEQQRRFIELAQQVESTPRGMDLTELYDEPEPPSEGLFRTMELWFPNRGSFADATAVWIWLGTPEALTPAQHTVISPQRWRPPRGVIHRECVTPASDLARWKNMSVTTPLRSMCDMLRYSEHHIAIALARMALQHELVSTNEVTAALKQFARQKYIARAMDRFIYVCAARPTGPEEFSAELEELTNGREILTDPE